MKLIFLPGLDGTGLLFEPFLKRIDTDIPVEIFRLSDDSNPDYQNIALQVVEQFKHDEVIIIAESYSGRIAYEIAKSSDLNISQIIFVASFLSIPSIFSKVSPFVPTELIRKGLLPKLIVSKILFGRYASQDLLELFYKAIKEVSSDVLRARLRQISCMDTPDIEIDVPCTYIQAKEDILISSSVLKTFKRCCKKLDIRELEGTHFLLQTNPAGCWQIIKEKVTV